MNTEFHTPFEWFMLMYIYRTWMEETYYYIPNQGRRQGVCLGGGGGGAKWPKSLATAARGQQFCAIPPTHFFPTSKNFQQKI